MNPQTPPHFPATSPRPEIGFITLGQSPRPDILSEMRNLLDPDLIPAERGALDGMTSRQVEALRPTGGEDTLLTRLADGTPVVVEKGMLVPLLNERIAELEDEGVGMVALLCTEAFAGLQSRGILLSPWELMCRTLRAMLPTGRIGVLGPLAAQAESVRHRWERATGLDTCVQIAPPYQESNDWSRLGEEFLREKVQVIVLDCFGYTKHVQNQLYSRTGKPVLLPRLLLAGWIRTLLRHRPMKV